MAVFLLVFNCSDSDSSIDDNNIVVQDGQQGCEGYDYMEWSTSPYVLPYPVGETYTIGLSHCGGPPHTEGAPDQFAINIEMDIGTLVVACRKGTIMFVEESGLDYEPTNNMVVLRDEDGGFIQYQHLTHNGALVEVGQFVDKGDPIGLSGASNNAPYPFLHFVVTAFGDWEFPYSRSYPITFSNTAPNPRSLIQGMSYEALPY